MPKVLKVVFVVLSSLFFLASMSACVETQETNSQLKSEESDRNIQKVKLSKQAVSLDKAKAPKKKNEAPVVMPAVAEYQELSIEGWVVKVSPTVRANQKLYQPIIKQLGKDFRRIKGALPSELLPQIQATVIWLEQGMPVKKLNSTFFNGSRKLTKKYGMVPESYGGIIIGNTKGYLALAGARKWQMLHELTHAYHQFKIKHNFAPVVGAFENTKKLNLHKPKFDKRIKGSGYPTRNKKEYLSELTVAYFGRKLFYPHNRKELAEYDPQGYCAVVKSWGLLGAQQGSVPLTCDL